MVECRLSTRAVRGGGYPCVTLTDRGRKKVVAEHRLVMEQILGRSLSPKEFVCHRCDNKRCVEPSHLFLGNALVNNRDRMQKGRSALGVRSGVSVLTPFLVYRMRELMGYGLGTSATARALRLKTTTVQAVREAITWIHTEGNRSAFGNLT